MPNWEEMPCSPKNQQLSGCSPKLVNQTENISMLLCKFIACQYLKHHEVLITTSPRQWRAREGPEKTIKDGSQVSQYDFSLCHREEMTYYRNCRGFILSQMGWGRGVGSDSSRFLCKLN